jgi:hypothetical protein
MDADHNAHPRDGRLRSPTLRSQDASRQLLSWRVRLGLALGYVVGKDVHSHVALARAADRLG